MNKPLDNNSKTNHNKWDKQMKDELMVQQQVENVWQHMVGVICLNQTGRKKVKKLLPSFLKNFQQDKLLESDKE